MWTVNLLILKMYPWCAIPSDSLRYCPMLPSQPLMQCPWPGSSPFCSPLPKNSPWLPPCPFPVPPPQPLPQWYIARRCAAARRCPAWSSAHGTAPPSAPGHHPAAAGLTRCGWWSCCGASCCWTQPSPCGRVGAEGRGLRHLSKVDVNQQYHSRCLSDFYCDPATISLVGESMTLVPSLGFRAL